jgi:hypothetical protein
MQEPATLGDHFDVLATVNLKGTTSKAKKDQKEPATAVISASSSVKYRERIIQLSDAGAVEATARRYAAAGVDKKTDDQQQRMTIRSAVERIIVRRADHQSTFFSPDGPLTFAELELLSADTFTPALSGLLPSGPVKPGEQWKATPEAVTELTGVGPIESGGLTCTFRERKLRGNKPVAQVALSGSITGPSDLGPTRDKVDGHFLFDLDRGLITYVLLSARREILGPGAKVIGTLEGRYELQRRPAAEDALLADAELTKLNLEATAETTALLFDSKDLAVRFLYPRNWELLAVAKNRIELEEPTGGNMRVLVDATPTPTAEKLRAELLSWLKTKQATMKDTGSVKPFPGPPAGERFTVQAAVAKKSSADAPSDEKLYEWNYVHMRGEGRSATVSASLTADRAATLRGDIDFVASSLKFLAKSR